DEEPELVFVEADELGGADGDFAVAVIDRSDLRHQALPIALQLGRSIAGHAADHPPSLIGHVKLVEGGVEVNAGAVRTPRLIRARGALRRVGRRLLEQRFQAGARLILPPGIDGGRERLATEAEVLAEVPAVDVLDGIGHGLAARARIARIEVAAVPARVQISAALLALAFARHRLV